MKKKKEYPRGEKIQERFDSFIKKSIRLVIYDVLDDHRRHRENVILKGLDVMDDIAAPEVAPDIEKIKVKIGSSFIFLENERLAEGIRKELDEKQRQILECFFVKDMPAKAISELMDLQEKTIFNYKYEALGILRKYMEECDDGI